MAVLQYTMNYLPNLFVYLAFIRVVSKDVSGFLSQHSLIVANVPFLKNNI